MLAGLQVCPPSHLHIPPLASFFLAPQPAVPANKSSSLCVWLSLHVPVTQQIGIHVRSHLQAPLVDRHHKRLDVRVDADLPRPVERAPAGDCGPAARIATQLLIGRRLLLPA
jgi:hypothetical protein